MVFQNPKGTMDYFPEEKAAFNKIAGLFRQSAIRYGYKEVESPAIEDIKLLTRKSGEEIKQQIFTLTKKGDEEFGLRFDLTVPLTRMFIEKQKSLSKPVKWFYITRMWRYEAPQAGRLREFYQFGVEVFGSGKAEADAEVISLAVDSLKSLGLTEKDIIVKINNRKLLQGLLLDIIDAKNLESVIRIIDKKSKISEEEFSNELKKLKLDKNQTAKIKNLLKINNINYLSKTRLNNLAQEGLNELNSIIKLLTGKKKFIKIDLSTARGLAYYTGTVFEIFDSRQKFRSVCGGGRYDDLVKLFGGQDTPATGFSIGFATLTLLLKDKKLLQEIDLGPDYYIAPVNEKVMQKAVEICEKLRKEYAVEIDLMGRNLGNQLKYADSIKAKNVIIVGDKDLKENKVTIKNMKTGKEEKISITKI